MLPGGKGLKMSRKTYIILCGLMLLFSTTLISDAVEITPETIDIELTGGDFTSREITLSNTESYSIDCKISTMILPNGDGINITYSKSTFTIPPHTTYQVEMKINTSISLEPNLYSIETKLEFINQEVSDSSSDNSPTFHYAITPDDEEDIPISTNETPPGKNETVLDTDNDNIIRFSPSCPFCPLIPLVIIIILLIVIVMLLCFIKRKNKKEKKKI